jgi:hypothetical protein
VAQVCRRSWKRILGRVRYHRGFDSLLRGFPSLPSLYIGCYPCEDGVPRSELTNFLSQSGSGISKACVSSPAGLIHTMELQGEKMGWGMPIIV